MVRIGDVPRPVQLIVLGFSQPDFHGEIIAELERLRASDTVRVIDSLAVYKSADGDLEVEHLSNLSEQEAIELGSKVGALIGLGFEGEQEAWDVLEDIPNDSAAALILLEHHWAVPLRDVIARAGGFRISDGFISPLDLVGIGLVSAEEAKELHEMETAAAGNDARRAVRSQPDTHVRTEQRLRTAHCRGGASASSHAARRCADHCDGRCWAVAGSVSSGVG